MSQLMSDGSFSSHSSKSAKNASHSIELYGTSVQLSDLAAADFMAFRIIDD